MVEIGSAHSVEHNLRLIPDLGEPWVATVRGEGYGYIFGVCTTPDPGVVSVVAGGGAYLIDVARRSWRTIDAFPVQQLVEVPDAGVLVVVDGTDMLGIGRSEPDGILDRVWASRRVATDDARVVRVTGTRLVCRGLDGFDAPFEVDATSGARIGGTTAPARRGPLHALRGLFGASERRDL